MMTGKNNIGGGKPLKVTFFGDSTCVGQGVSIYQGWVTKIARSLDEYGSKVNHEILVTNSSINGRTTRQALEDMPYHVSSHEPDILVVQFGLNDCNHWQTDRGVPRVSLPAFIANIQEIIERASRFGVKRVLLNNNHPTSRDKSVMPGSDLTFEQSNKRYNSALRDVAHHLPSFVSFQDIETLFANRLSDNQSLDRLLLADGLHLSSAGHDVYFELMFPVVKTAVDLIISNISSI